MQSTSSPGGGTARSGAPLLTWILYSVTALVLLTRLFMSFDEYPESYVDEVLYSEPAVELAADGRLAAPGVARQLAEKGVPGLTASYCITLPTVPVLRGVLMAMLHSPDLLGIRLTDWLFISAAAISLQCVLIQIGSSWRPALVLAVFIISPAVNWINGGRQEAIAVAFGVSALALLFRNSRMFTREPSWMALSCIGVLLALAATSHPFAGVFWSFTVSACLAVHLRPVRTLRCLLAIGLPAAAVCGLTTLYMFSVGNDGLLQFRWLLSLKQQLLFNFPAAAQGLAIQTVGRNPLVPFLCLAGLFHIPRNLRRLAIALIASLILLAIWRCKSFESYNICYAVHFWTAGMILLAVSLEGLIRGEKPWQRFLVHNPACRASVAGLLILTGLAFGYNKWLEAFAFDHSARHHDIREALARELPSHAEVLVTSDLYFLVSRELDKTVTISHERLDITQFDYVLSRDPMKTVKYRDQWFDLLTPEQYASLEQHFEQRIVIPTEYMKVPSWYPGSYIPHRRGLVLYKRKTPTDP